MRIFRGIRRPFGGFFSDQGEQQAEAARGIEDRLSQHLDQRLNIEFGRLTRKMERIMRTLAEVLDLVSQQTTKIDSIDTLMDGMRAEISQLLQNANTDQTTQQLVDQVFEKLKDNSDKIDAAITENTPAATAGAVSDGPSAADIKDEIKMPAPNPEPEPTAQG